jgi:hypothetical protein
MLFLLLAMAYCYVLFLCQILNGATLCPGVLIIFIALFIRHPTPHLSSIQAIIWDDQKKFLEVLIVKMTVIENRI